MGERGNDCCSSSTPCNTQNKLSHFQGVSPPDVAHRFMYARICAEMCFADRLNISSVSKGLPTDTYKVSRTAPVPCTPPQ